MTLLRGVLRGLWRAPSRLVALWGLVAVATAVFSGTGAALRELELATDALYSELRLPDGLLSLPPTDAARLPPLEGVSARLELPGTVRWGDQWSSAQILAVDLRTRPAASDVRLIEGTWLTHLDDALVDATFAADRGVQVGDRLTVRVGSTTARLRVAGIVLHPEFLLASVDDRFTIPLRRTVGLVILARQQILATTWVDRVNTLAVRGDLDAARRAVEAAGVPVLGVRPQTEIYSVYCHWNRLVGFRDFLPAVVGLFDALGALSAFLLVRQAVRRSRRELGALLALGLPPVRIVTAWMAAMLVAITPGLVAGLLLGRLLAEAVVVAYADSTGFFPVGGALPAGPFLSAAGLAAVLVPAASALPVWSALREGPGALLRDLPEVDAPARPWRLPLPERVGLSLLLRRPGRALGIAATLAGTQVMAMSLWVFADGLALGLDRFLDGQRWDAELDLSAPLAPSEVGALAAAVGAAEAVGVRAVATPLGPDRRMVSLVGLHSGWRGDGDLLEGRDPGPDEVVVPLRLAQAWSVGVGDTLRAGERDLRVSGVVNNYVLNVAFVAPEPGPVSAVLLRRPTALAAAVDRPGVARIVSQTDVARSAREIVGVLVYFLRLYAVFGAVVGGWLLWTTLGVAAQDAEGSVAVLRAVGWGRGALARLWLAQAAALAAVSTALAIPANRVSLAIFQARLARINVWVDVSSAGGAELAGVFVTAMVLAASVLPALWIGERLRLGEVLGRE